MILASLKFFIIGTIIAQSNGAAKKNVIIIMVDDLGFHDLSFRGSNEIPTPNIDALAYNGIVLNRHYTPPLCSPSRSAVMTGKYPHRTGMQEIVLLADEGYGLPINEKIMPQYFKDVGYKTHLIGKWHLGFYQQQYTPTRRGFDSFFGYYNGAIDYFDHTHLHTNMVTNKTYRGKDLHNNFDTVYDREGEYATNLFTNEAVKIIKNHNRLNPLFLMLNHLAPHAGNEDKPMQARPEDINRFPYIQDTQRRILAAMMYQLDLGVGEVVKALKDTGLLQDSIIVFYSDNGGPTAGRNAIKASNYPLRGQKQSGWEGGIRTAALIFAPFLPSSVVKEGMMYVGDWLPTLNTLANAGFTIKADIDGVDQSQMLRSTSWFDSSKRSELVVIDDVTGYSAYIYNGWKLVSGSSSRGVFDVYLGVTSNYTGYSSYETLLFESTAWKALPKSAVADAAVIRKWRSRAKFVCGCSIVNTCNLLNGPCLFDILNDPCERNDVSKVYAYQLQSMQNLRDYALLKLIQSRRTAADPASDPQFNNMTWKWWQNDS